MFDLNLFGLIDVTNAALPHLRARRSGTVVHIGSRSSWNSEVPVSSATAPAPLRASERRVSSCCFSGRRSLYFL